MTTERLVDPYWNPLSFKATDAQVRLLNAMIQAHRRAGLRVKDMVSLFPPHVKSVKLLTDNECQDVIDKLAAHKERA